jgi:hypothetical protein
MHSGSKLCSKCGCVKLFDEFAKSKARKDGLNGHCKACIKAWRDANVEVVRAKARERHAENAERNNRRSAEWRKANPEYVGSYMQEWLKTGRHKKVAADKAYRQANAEAIRLRKRLEYEASRDAIKARVREYQQANKERLRPSRAAATRKRYATKRQAAPAWASVEAMCALYEQADALTRETGERYEVDHIVPLQSKLVCGLHCEANLRVVKVGENRSKGNRWWPDMPSGCLLAPSAMLTG